ncbi:MAG: CoA-binding protein [Comamonadaceae bacterium]|nr:MAG: CoA-binding protein [Comamonadaceae bacterium]
MHTLHSLFFPESVALIGASSDPERIGGRVLRFMIEGGYKGTIYPINKGEAVVQGLKAYKNITEVEGQIDQAVIIIPAAGVETALRESISKGVKSVQILTAGFAEIDEAGKVQQQKLVDICREHNVRMLGPNALGLLNLSNQFSATFSTALNGLRPVKGHIALATQSGAFGSATYGMASLRGLGFSKIIATGNEADVDVAECIDYLAEDPETKVICAAVESCKDGNRLRLALLKAARAGKPVLIMKAGRTEVGATAAATHTGSLAGNDTVYDTVFAECGAFRPQSIEEMLDIAYVCVVAGALPSNSDVAILTGSGGIGILMADHASDHGLALPPLSAQACAAVNEVLPFAVAANPLDTTAQVTSVPGGVTRTLDALLTHSSCATVFAYLAHVGLSPTRFQSTSDEMIALKARFPDRSLVMVMLATKEVAAVLDTHGIPTFADPSRAVLALGGAYQLALRREKLATPGTGKPAAKSASPLGDVSTEAAAKKVLADAGLPMLPERVCDSAESAAATATSFGFPVVAKISSPDIPHKTEVGGVMLNLQDAEAVRLAYDELIRRAKAAVPGARIDGVLVTPMVKGGVETIMGIHMDPTFGPMVMFGSGGTAVELFKDVAFASAPVSEARARELIDAVKSSQLLRQWRGGPQYDEQALVDAICKLSEFGEAHAGVLESIDVNPLVVREKGAVCLDAVITLR